MTKYRSQFEREAAACLEGKCTYETDKLKYTIPASDHTYTPDFTIAPNIFLETKGIWDKKDRDKIILVLKQNPHIRIIMCFMNPNVKIRKGSPTSYYDFCIKNNIEMVHRSQLVKLVDKIQKETLQ
jgi:hypothetical protein